MKLSEHTDHIRLLIDKAFRNRLGRMGFSGKEISGSNGNQDSEEYKRILTVYNVFRQETGNEPGAFEKLVEELTFTLFNRLAALKVMEAHTLHPEIVTRRSQHGNRSFAHFAWLEQNPGARQQEAEGSLAFLEEQLEKLAEEIPLFSPRHPFHLMPTSFDLNNIIDGFNQVETDQQVDQDIWKSDDILGWLYESYQAAARKKLKEDKLDIEYDKVYIQSCVYTPRWVVRFLVDNSLGKLYLEMFPDSEIRHRYKIANAPKIQSRERKPLHEIRMIDPATGSGNFMLYGFDLFYNMYLDQIENYGADYDVDEVPRLIIEHNLHGIDLDDRAVQLAQLGLFIKAKRKKRSVKIDHFNVVSSDFFLPPYAEVKHIFESNGALGEREKAIMAGLWNDLQNAYRFGSLIRLEEKLSLRWFGTRSNVPSSQVVMFEQENLEDFEAFRETFFASLQKTVAQNTARQGLTFLNTKTEDAITFLQLLTQKYDVAVANPPYTDSADFGPELKKFVEANYKHPNKFNSNLYAAFIKRNCELTLENGYVGMIHPHTFMFIKTFFDVRKYIIKNTHIELLVDYGLDRVNLFGPGILLDAAWYVLSKKKKDSPGVYFNITANQQEKTKKGSLEQAFDDFLNRRSNNRVYPLPQEKLKIIEGWPFIYWISDGFREKFKEKALDDMLFIRQGGATGDNLRTLRLWWEVADDTLSREYGDKKKWVIFQKGGPFSKWYGNNWCIIGYNDPIEYQFLKNNGNSLPSEDKYFLEGVTYCSSGSKGTSFRYMPSNHIISGAGPGILPNFYTDIYYFLGFLNSKLSFYIADCLNPTVNTTQGDLKRIPFVMPQKHLERSVSSLSNTNVEIKKNICSYRVIETNFNQSPLTAFQGTSLKDKVLAYLNFENAQLTKVLLNEAIINELIFEVYELSDADREQVEAKMGVSVGSLAVLKEAKNAFLAQLQNPLAEVNEHIQNLPITSFDYQQIREIKEGFSALFQSNNDLEEFCIRHQVNPINLWYWFKQANILPQARAGEIGLEFLADSIRTLLQQDDDGIIPLTGLPGEPRLSDRLEQYCLQKGFTSAQYLQLDSLIGRPMDEYLEHHFFRNLSDHLNLFMYLPKTPFIWHLSSGPQQGFEAYVLIYKWNRDSLFRLKSQYLGKRVENLQYRQIELKDSLSAQAQNEKEKIRLQLQEIESFSQKLDELIAEGYNHALDDGVGKNIAPLQKKGMLRAEVLNKTQLEKYLNADW